jgi:NAD(P)-dependent dehydrogenase (short-subunit alcohol dehydrogenase family)
VPHLVAYSASKGALNVMTRNVANGMRHNGVRVHAINLGWTVTPAERRIQGEVHGLPPDWPEAEGAKQPFGRLLVPEDCAALCAFLASKSAEMMTGNIVDLEQWVVGTLDAR